jgi:hypothetical protein
MLQQYYEAQSENTKLVYEKKQLEKVRAELTAKWEHHKETFHKPYPTTEGASCNNSQQSLSVGDVNATTLYATQYLLSGESTPVANVMPAAVGTPATSALTSAAAAAANRESDGDESCRASYDSLSFNPQTPSFMLNFETADTSASALNDDGPALMQSSSDFSTVLEYFSSAGSADSAAAAGNTSITEPSQHMFLFDSLSNVGDDANIFPNEITNAGLGLSDETDEVTCRPASEAKPIEEMFYVNELGDIACVPLNASKNVSLYSAEGLPASGTCELFDATQYAENSRLPTLGQSPEPAFSCFTVGESSDNGASMPIRKPDTHVEK